jgi:hypothetical protein
VPVLRSDSSTLSTDGGSPPIGSPLTTAPASLVDSRTYSRLLRRLRLKVRMICDGRCVSAPRDSRRSSAAARTLSATSSCTEPVRLAGMAIGTRLMISCPLGPRRATDTTAAAPARGRVVSSQTRSMRAERASSEASMVSAIRSTSIGSEVFLNSCVSGPAT